MKNFWNKSFFSKFVEDVVRFLRPLIRLNQKIAKVVLKLPVFTSICVMSVTVVQISFHLRDSSILKNYSFFSVNKKVQLNLETFFMQLSDKAREEKSLEYYRIKKILEKYEKKDEDIKLCIDFYEFLGKRHPKYPLIFEYIVNSKLRKDTLSLYNHFEQLGSRIFYEIGEMHTKEETETEKEKKKKSYQIMINIPITWNWGDDERVSNFHKNLEDTISSFIDIDRLNDYDFIEDVKTKLLYNQIVSFIMEYKNYLTNIENSYKLYLPRSFSNKIMKIFPKKIQITQSYKKSIIFIIKNKIKRFLQNLNPVVIINFMVEKIEGIEGIEEVEEEIIVPPITQSPLIYHIIKSCIADEEERLKELQKISLHELERMEMGRRRFFFKGFLKNFQYVISCSNPLTIDIKKKKGEYIDFLEQLHLNVSEKNKQFRKQKEREKKKELQEKNVSIQKYFEKLRKTEENYNSYFWDNIYWIRKIHDQIPSKLEGVSRNDSDFLTKVSPLSNDFEEDQYEIVRFDKKSWDSIIQKISELELKNDFYTKPICQKKETKSLLNIPINMEKYDSVQSENIEIYKFMELTRIPELVKGAKKVLKLSSKMHKYSLIEAELTKLDEDEIQRQFRQKKHEDDIEYYKTRIISENNKNFDSAKLNNMFLPKTSFFTSPPNFFYSFDDYLRYSLRDENIEENVEFNIWQNRDKDVFDNYFKSDSHLLRTIRKLPSLDTENVVSSEDYLLESIFKFVRQNLSDINEDIIIDKEKNKPDEGYEVELSIEDESQQKKYEVILDFENEQKYIEKFSNKKPLYKGKPKIDKENPPSPYNTQEQKHLDFLMELNPFGINAKEDDDDSINDRDIFQNSALKPFVVLFDFLYDRKAERKLFFESREPFAKMQDLLQKKRDIYNELVYNNLFFTPPEIFDTFFKYNELLNIKKCPPIKSSSNQIYFKKFNQFIKKLKNKKVTTKPKWSYYTDPEWSYYNDFENQFINIKNLPKSSNQLIITRDMSHEDLLEVIRKFRLFYRNIPFSTQLQIQLQLMHLVRSTYFDWKTSTKIQILEENIQNILKRLRLECYKNMLDFFRPYNAINKFRKKIKFKIFETEVPKPSVINYKDSPYHYCIRLLPKIPAYVRRPGLVSTKYVTNAEGMPFKNYPYPYVVQNILFKLEPFEEKRMKFILYFLSNSKKFIYNDLISDAEKEKRIKRKPEIQKEESTIPLKKLPESSCIYNFDYLYDKFYYRMDDEFLEDFYIYDENNKIIEFKNDEFENFIDDALLDIYVSEILKETRQKKFLYQKYPIYQSDMVRKMSGYFFPDYERSKLPKILNDYKIIEIPLLTSHKVLHYFDIAEKLPQAKIERPRKDVERQLYNNEIQIFKYNRKIFEPYKDEDEFFHLCENFNDNSWSVIFVVSSGWIFYHIFRALYKKYAKEIIESGIDFLYKAGFLEDAKWAKQELNLGLINRGYRGVRRQRKRLKNIIGINNQNSALQITEMVWFLKLKKLTQSYSLDPIIRILTISNRILIKRASIYQINELFSKIEEEDKIEKKKIPFRECSAIVKKEWSDEIKERINFYKIFKMNPKQEKLENTINRLNLREIKKKLEKEKKASGKRVIQTDIKVSPSSKIELTRKNIDFDKIRNPSQARRELLRDSTYEFRIEFHGLYEFFKQKEGVYKRKKENENNKNYLSKCLTKSGNLKPKGFLFVGPPGTGKTLLTQAIAGETGVPVVTQSGGLLNNAYVRGRGSKSLIKLFKRAKEIAPCIVFIDEVDSIGKRRPYMTRFQDIFGRYDFVQYLEYEHEIRPPSTYKMEFKRRFNYLDDTDLYWAEPEFIQTIRSKNNIPVDILQDLQFYEGLRSDQLNTLGQLLIELDGINTLKNIIIICATNRPEILDPALLRPGRLQRTLYLDLPDKQARIKLFKLYSKTSKIKVDKSVSWNYFAKRTNGLSSADIAAIVFSSQLTAVLAQKKHTYKTLERGIDLVTSFPYDPALVRVTKIINIMEVYIDKVFCRNILYSIRGKRHPNKEEIESIKISEKSKSFGNQNLYDYIVSYGEIKEVSHLLRGCYYNIGKLIIPICLGLESYSYVNLKTRPKNFRFFALITKFNEFMEYEKKKFTKEQIEKKLLNLFSGKAAELIVIFTPLLTFSYEFHFQFDLKLIVFKNILEQSNFGIEDDLQKAYILLKLMIEKWYLYTEKVATERFHPILQSANLWEFSERDLFMRQCIVDEMKVNLDMRHQLSINEQKNAYHVWWMKNVAEQVNFRKSEDLSWSRIYLSDPYDGPRNIEWVAPEEYFHTNIRMPPKSMSWATYLKKGRYRILHFLFMEALNTNFTLLRKFPEFMDFLADYFLRHECIREKIFQSKINQFHYYIKKNEDF